MWAENAYYGHRDTLARYADVRLGTPIPGRLQPGWQPGPGHCVDTFSQPGLHLVWSQRNVDAANAAGFSDVVAIGAPWLYADLPLSDAQFSDAQFSDAQFSDAQFSDAQFSDAGAAADAGEALLAIPFHGWEREKVAGDFDRYADALAVLAEREAKRVSVCMYWAEYEDPALRAVFERRGFAVVTAGRRDDPDFLPALRRLIFGHHVVTSNRVATATFYALACRRDFVLHGPSMGLAGSDDPDGSAFDQWQRAAFPLLCQRPSGRLDPARAEALFALGRRELGAEFVRDADTLRELLLWRRGQRPALLAALGRRQLGRLRRALGGDGHR
jgi:hypothetical protein